jgi:hypothetical protein
MNATIARGTLVAAVLNCLAVLHAADATAADVYKWVDEDGKVHFGDKPQAAGAEAIEVNPSAPAATGARQRHERTQRVLDAMTSERKDREQARQASREEAAERKRKCGVARAELHRRETSNHLFYRDEEGNKRIIGGEEYEAAIQEARDAVTEWCK